MCDLCIRVQQIKMRFNSNVLKAVLKELRQEKDLEALVGTKYPPLVWELMVEAIRFTWLLSLH